MQVYIAVTIGMETIVPIITYVPIVVLMLMLYDPIECYIILVFTADMA